MDAADHARQARERLHACTTASDVRKTLESMCSQFGEVRNISLLCSRDTPNIAMCIIDFVDREGAAEDSVSRCAEALGGRIFGFSSVIVTFTPAEDYCCGQSFPPASASCSCHPRN